MNRSGAAGRSPVVALVTAVAIADWAIALGWTIAGTRRELSAPLLALAWLALVALHLPWLRSTGRHVRAAAARGESRWEAAEAALSQRWSPTVARLLLREPRLLWSVVLLARGRFDGSPARHYPSHRDVLPIWVTLALLAVAELAVVPLLPLPAVVDTVLLAAGCWALLVVAGLIAALVVHPHLLTDDELRVRLGFWDEVRVPRSGVAAARVELRTAVRGLSVGKSTVTATSGSLTNVTLDVVPPMTVRGVSVTRVRLWADSPGRLVEDLRQAGY
jgi:hypothetical protein